MQVLFSLPLLTVFHQAQSDGAEEDMDSCVGGGSPAFDGRRHGSDFVLQREPAATVAHNRCRLP